jgi:hypothetical protein
VLFFAKCHFTREKHVRGRNIDAIKVEARVRIQHFLICAFKKFYVGIWSFMLIEDVMEVLTLLLSQDFFANLFSFGGMNNV